MATFVQVEALIGYGRVVTSADEELAAAVAGREHWSLDGAVGVYAPAHEAGTVRVRALAARTTVRERYAAVLYRVDGRPERSLACRFAQEAIVWAERLLLSQ